MNRVAKEMASSMPPTPPAPPAQPILTDAELDAMFVADMDTKKHSSSGKSKSKSKGKVKGKK